jgi:hypothetical protein
MILGVLAVRSDLILVGLVIVVSHAVTGCNPPGPDRRITRVQQLEDKVQQQGRLLVQKDEQIAAQAERIQQLQGLTGQRAIENLVHVASIEIDRLSGGHDDDRDSVDEGVVVYLRLLDRDGDAIKVAGSARVRLLDLAKAEGSQVVGEQSWDPTALAKVWYGRLLTYHYTLKVPWAGGAKRADHKSITVLVEFTDLLSGQVFTAQKVVEVNGAAG